MGWTRLTAVWVLMGSPPPVTVVHLARPLPDMRILMCRISCALRRGYIAASALPLMHFQLHGRTEAAVPFLQCVPRRASPLHPSDEGFGSWRRYGRAHRSIPACKTCSPA